MKNFFITSALLVLFAPSLLLCMEDGDWTDREEQIDMNPATLEDMAAKKVLEDVSVLRNFLKNQSLVPLPVEDLLRDKFNQKSRLLSNLSKDIRKINFSTEIKDTGIFYAGFDEDFQSIRVNIEDSDAYSIKQIRPNVYYKIDFNGKKEEQKNIYASPNFRNTNRLLSDNDVDLINKKYGLQIKKNNRYHTMAMCNPEKDKILQIFRWRQITIYDFSRYNELKDFCENRMPLNQVVLLALLEKAKEKKLVLQFTKNEQEIFNGLLPEIKEIAFGKQESAWCNLI